MPRLLPQFGIVLALFVATVFLASVEEPSANRSPIAEMATSSVPLIFPALAPLPPLVLPKIKTEEIISEETPHEAPQAPTPPPVATTEKAVAATQAIIPAEVVTPTSGVTNLDTTAEVLREALVNIVCYVPSGLHIHSMSGSGVIIDPKGIILTNAHIAQYFLLHDLGVSCRIRTGGPAVEKYKASLMYISPAWITKNAKLLTSEMPNGTGEYDFALLAITKSVDKEPLPSSFPAIPLATAIPDSRVAVVIAGYGAQFLASLQIQSSLFPTIVFGSIHDVFTFGERTIDVFDLGGSAAAQKGSSGGGVADVSGNLIGTITTSTVEGTTDTRKLDAITATYIRGAYAGETGEAIDLLLGRPLEESIAKFIPKREELEALLRSHLP